MNGLYALKPWWADRLASPRRVLVRHDVAPAVVSWTGVGFAVAAGAVLAFRPAGVVTGAVVGGLLAGRLACANLDGGLARATGASTAWGSVVNEVTDRLADLVALAALAGPAAGAPLWLVALAGLGATLPSWVALAGVVATAAAAAPPDLSGPEHVRTCGGPDNSRVQGGPVGKTERCALLVAAGLLGHAGGVAAVIAVGGVVTAAVRLHAVRRSVAGSAR